MNRSLHRSATGRRSSWSGLIAASVTLAALGSWGVAPVSAATVCDPGGDVCVVVPDTVQTPVGLVTVEVSASNVVTVHLDPATPNTLVFGIPFAIPPRPPSVPGYTRTTIDTAGGVVDIDTFQIPPGPPARFVLPDLAIISIHPPGPCRVQTSGTSVVFTPIIPPGPPA